MPLPAGQKKSPPEGFTGKKDEVLRLAADRDAWRNALVPYLEDDKFASSNTGIRLPRNVLALDVDEYENQKGVVKKGWQNLAALAEAVGIDHPNFSLPATVRLTARGYRGKSGQLFFRVPSGLDADEVMDKLPGVAVPDVEVLRPWHRYTLEAGSLHPDGQVYRLYDERLKKGRRELANGFGSITPEDLPELPQEWLDALLSVKPNVVAGSDQEGGVDADARAAAEQAYEAWLDENDLSVDDLSTEQMMSIFTVGARERILALGDRSKNNANVTTACISLLATFMEDLSPDDPLPLRQGIELAKSLYVRNGSREDRPGEFDRALVWAFPIAQRAVQSGESRATLDWATRLVEDDFWGQTEVLRSCRDFARSRLVSPDAMLACALVVVSSWLPPHLVLPGLVGDVAGLNFFVALAAASGGGKSAAMKAAKSWLHVRPHEHSDLATDEPYVTTVSTAQGLVQAYTMSQPKPKNQQVRPGEIEHIQVRRSVRFEVDEIGALGAAMNAEGSMLKDFLKTMWTGSGVGTTAAEAARVRKLEDNSFRMTIVAGVQPSTADVILSGHGDGFPQRWLWVEAFDEKPLSREEWIESRKNPPAPLGWTPPLAAHPLPMPVRDDDDFKKVTNAFRVAHSSDQTLREIEITESFGMKVYQAAASASRRIGDVDVTMAEVLDGHSVLLQEKLAALVAALHGSIDITDQFERIAEHLSAKSDATRAAILKERHEDSLKAMQSQAIRQGHSEAVAAGARREVEVDRLLGAVLERLTAAGAPIPISEINTPLIMGGTLSDRDATLTLRQVPGVVVEDGMVRLGAES